MRIVKHTRRFRPDYKRDKSGRHGKRLDAHLLETAPPGKPYRYKQSIVISEWLSTEVSFPFPILIRTLAPQNINELREPCIRQWECGGC